MKTREHNGIKYEVVKGWRSFIPFTNNKYLLLEDYTIYVGILGFDIDTDYARLTPGGYLTLYVGAISDGPSGPTYDSINFMRGAWVHDILYHLLRDWELPPRYRFDADIILYLIIKEDGMSGVRAMAVYQGVLRGAQAAALPAAMKIVPTEGEE